MVEKYEPISADTEKVDRNNNDSADYIMEKCKYNNVISTCKKVMGLSALGGGIGLIVTGEFFKNRNDNSKQLITEQPVMNSGYESAVKNQHAHNYVGIAISGLSAAICFGLVGIYLAKMIKANKLIKKIKNAMDKSNKGGIEEKVSTAGIFRNDE